MRHPSLLFFLACITLASARSGVFRPGTALDPLSKVADRSHTLLIRPVILCDDDGSHPADHAFPKTLVDQVYTTADLEFLYLEPIRWNHGKARRGELSLDEIVRLSTTAGIIHPDPHVVTMLFVSAVDGNPGPLGRGQQNGSICFVSLGPKGAMDDPAQRAFVVAHEVGHCLNLIHAIDDPAVPDDVPNLQGDGPFAERLAVTSLHATQRDTVLKSRLLLPRFHCLTRTEAAAALTDESWEPYLSQATTETMRFSLGLTHDASIPASQEARLAFARDHFAAIADVFSPEETRVLEQAVSSIRESRDAAWPMLTRTPWLFVKTRDSFCNGLPHTRGLITFLSPRALQRIATDEDFASVVLLHEKTHIIQRLNPARFAPLYQTYGFKPATLAPGEMERLGIIQNPDAFTPDWAADINGMPVIIATIADPQDDGRIGFAEIQRTLVPSGSGTFTIGGAMPDGAPVEDWKKRFPIPTGHDHPNEVFAYLLGTIDRAPAGSHEKDQPSLRETLRQLPSILRLDGD